MKTLSIILVVTEDGVYLRETAQAALAAASALHVDMELILVSNAATEAVVRKELQGLQYRMYPCPAERLARFCNRGAEIASGSMLLFLQEGMILTAEGLEKLLHTLLLNEEITAVGPFSNRTVFSWQYIKAEEMEMNGEGPSEWLSRHLTSPSESLFLEAFALLVRRSAFQRVGGFDEAFTGGADIDLSFRLKYEGFYLLRVPAYLEHRGAGHCDLYDALRGAASFA